MRRVLAHTFTGVLFHFFFFLGFVTGVTIIGQTGRPVHAPVAVVSLQEHAQGVRVYHTFIITKVDILRRLKNLLHGCRRVEGDEVHKFARLQQLKLLPRAHPDSMEEFVPRLSEMRYVQFMSNLCAYI